MSDFPTELTALLNRYSWDETCSTPDFLLAENVVEHLRSLAITIERRADWAGR